MSSLTTRETELYEALRKNYAEYEHMEALLENGRRDNEQLRAALVEIQTMTREFVDKHRGNGLTRWGAAFWRIAHVEKIAREALGEGE